MSDMPEQTAERIEILRNDEAGRYEITVDGDVAGFADFQNDGGVRIMPHTVIDPAYGGLGLGGTLVRFALDDTRAAGFKVAPHCSFVDAFMTKNPEYADLRA